MFLVGFSLMFAGTAGGALIGGGYEINWDQDVERKPEGTTNIRKFKHILELKYKGMLSAVVKNEISFKFEQEINSNAPDTTRYLPTLDLAFKGKYWEARAGGKRTHDNSDDPAKNPKIADSYFVEFYYAAPKRVPDLKAKYMLDTEFEDTVTDTRKQEIALSSVYTPTQWLEVKGDYDRKTDDDKLNPNSDTEEEFFSGSVDFRHTISDKVRVGLQYAVEQTRGATLLDLGGSTNGKNDQKQTVKSLVGIRPFRDTTIDGFYDYELKQNIINGEHTLMSTGKAVASQRIGNPYTVKGEFNRIITETRHSADDNRKTEDTWTVDFSAKISKQFDFYLKRQDKHLAEDHVDTTKSKTTSTINDTATWAGELTPFWKASASYDRTANHEWDAVARQEVETTVDTKYSLKSLFDFKAIWLTIEPTYDVTMKDDHLKSQDTATRDFKFRVAYKVLSTKTIEAKVEHTYGRKTDSLAHNIQRTDNSSANMTVNNPLPGWIFSFDVTRSATDTSQDDVGPDITSTFGFKIDYKYEWLMMNTSYKYDKKSLTDSTETFAAKGGWVAPRWEVSLTYTFDKTFSEEINEKYTVSLTFKYNL